MLKEDTGVVAVAREAVATGAGGRGAAEGAVAAVPRLAAAQLAGGAAGIQILVQSAALSPPLFRRRSHHPC